jgi:F-type H+-transporting ATPase subunit b
MSISVIPDWSTLVQIVNFLLIIFALHVFLYKPIRGILKERKEKFGGLGMDAQKARAEAAAKEKALEAGIAQARAEGAKAREALIQAAEEEQKRALAEINAKAQKDLEELRGQIAREVEGARKALSADVGAYASLITEKILGRAVQ